MIYNYTQLVKKLLKNYTINGQIFTLWLGNCNCSVTKNVNLVHKFPTIGGFAKAGNFQFILLIWIEQVIIPVATSKRKVNHVRLIVIFMPKQEYHHHQYKYTLEDIQTQQTVR